MFGTQKDTVFKPMRNIGANSVILITDQRKKQEKVTDLRQKMLVDTNNLMEILDCGKHTAIEIGNLANAKVCFGRKLFWNVKLIQQYVDSIAE